jgi:hypothetical protein
MKKSRKVFRSFTLFLLLNSIVIDAYSIAISARRLYLDPKSSSTNIRVHNTDSSMQSCTVEIKDVVINNFGNIMLVTNADVTENSAKPLIRLAPRRFKLGVNEHQMVKLLYRRKPGLNNGEYHGVLAIKCVEKTEKNDRLVSIIPSLVHNVPVIVRTGKLPIQAEFVSTIITDNKLKVELKIQGSRSITGNIEVINSDSGDLISEQKNVSIYAQQPVKKLEFSLGKNKNTPLLIKFTEDPEMGGELMIQQPIK